MVTLAAVLVGGGVALGLLLIGLGVRGVPPSLAKRRRGRLRWRSPFSLPAMAAALGVVVSTLLLTRWPVGTVLAGVAALALPRLLGGSRQRRAVVQRTEAIARWTEMLRDTMAGASGLEEAILVTAAVAPRPIAPQVDRLAVRLERQPLPEALRLLAGDLSDPAGDLLVAALTTAATKETREVGRLLSALSTSTRDVVRMHERVETSRSGIRSAVQMITLTVALFIGLLILLGQEYLQPYGTLEGQLWLVLVGGTFAGAFVLLRRMATVSLPPRSFAAGSEEA